MPAGAPAAYEVTKARVAAHFEGSSTRWTRMTSDEPLGYLRETVRRGRREMQEALLAWLPRDLAGRRILDAGCGPGELALALADRGAEVLGVDLSPSLIAEARRRARDRGLQDRARFRAGDMLAPGLGGFDHVVALDSLIHYPTPALAGALEGLAAKASGSVLFTVAPRSPLLLLMHSVGRLFPRTHRSPPIVPVHERRLSRALSDRAGLVDWRFGRERRVRSGFYVSRGLELRPEAAA